MRPIDLDTLSTIMTNQSIALSAISTALAADLAVSPVVISTPPGIGTSTLINELAGPLSLHHLDVRCASLSIEDLAPMATTVGGEHISSTGLFGELDRLLVGQYPLLILLDEVDRCVRDIPLAILRRIASNASAPVIVVLRTLSGQEDAALSLVAEGLDLHCAHVPTAVLGLANMTASQPVLAIGSIQMNGSKFGQKFLEMDCQLPYEHSLRFTLVADESESDDDLADTIGPLLDLSKTVAVRLTPTSDGLWCNTKDIVEA